MACPTLAPPKPEFPLVAADTRHEPESTVPNYVLDDPDEDLDEDEEDDEADDDGTGENGDTEDDEDDEDDEEEEETWQVSGHPSLKVGKSLTSRSELLD